MSDTENESAFESADEGGDNHEPYHQRADAGHRHQEGHLHNDDADGREDEGVSTDISDEEAPNIQPMALLPPVAAAQVPAEAEKVNDSVGCAWEVDEDVLASTNEPSKISSEEVGASGAELKTKEPSKQLPMTQASASLESLPSTSRSGISEGDLTERGATGTDGVVLGESITKCKDSERADETTVETNDAGKSQQSSGWGGWGASLLSVASTSVATFTSQVGQGFNAVIDTVESSLGAPPAAELAAQMNQGENKRLSDATPDATNTSNDKGESASDLLGNLVTGVSSLTTILEQTSSRVLTGGLDTLELLGRKTMDILQEGDPGLKKKKQFLHGNKPNLSEVLREAKEKAEEFALKSEEKDADKQIHFGTIFDDCQGLVHLEALEMLSKQCEQKVQSCLLSFSGEELKEMQGELDTVKEKSQCRAPDDDADDSADHDFAALVTQHLGNLKITLNMDRLLQVQAEARASLDKCAKDQDAGVHKDPKEIQNQAITFLAMFTARVIELIHKTCELLLLTPKDEMNVEIQNFVNYVSVVCTEVAICASKFSTCLNTAADDSETPEQVTPLITNVFLEASNSSTYIQDAFQLVTPIFQHKYLTNTTK